MLQAWIDLQQRHLAEASKSLSDIQNASLSEKDMAQAVMFWQEQYIDQALARFEIAAISQPEWRNPVWVRALYSPLVAESVEQMQRETEHRKKKTVALR